MVRLGVGTSEYKVTEKGPHEKTGSCVGPRLHCLWFKGATEPEENRHCQRA